MLIHRLLSVINKLECVNRRAFGLGFQANFKCSLRFPFERYMRRSRALLQRIADENCKRFRLPRLKGATYPVATESPADLIANI